jgi:hypothetical protein
MVVHECPVIIGGDMNVHIEDEADADAVKLSELFTSFDLVQHVSGLTHRLGGTLDLVAAFSDYTVDDVHVDPSDIISDHALVTCSLSSNRTAVQTPTRNVRSWRTVDRVSLRQAIRDSKLSEPSSSGSAEELFTLYDSELRCIADQFAPERSVRYRSHLLTP